MIGILSAFGAATSWTYACFIWRSQTQKYKSIDINLIKNIIAFLIFIPAFINLSSTTELKNIFILLISGIIGIGLGEYLLKTAILTAWDSNKIETLTVNTCSLDHKRALQLYQKNGFSPVKFKNFEKHV